MSGPDELLARIDRVIAEWYSETNEPILPVLHDCHTHIAANAALAARCEKAKKVVDQQAEDEGLWFVATRASEAYLQQALRELHTAVEDNILPDAGGIEFYHHPNADNR